MQLRCLEECVFRIKYLKNTDRNDKVPLERYSEETVSNGKCCHPNNSNMREGDSMKVGFIGAGRAGCSLGKYFALKAKQEDVTVTGYYSMMEEDAQWAATFTKSFAFKRLDDVIAASDTIILSTPDGAIKNVWDVMNKNDVNGKILCHLSGSLSSDVFSGIEAYGGYALSVHPMFAFSNKESVYEQLNEVSFTLEGHSYGVNVWKTLLQKLGNHVVVIDKENKAMYHGAASLLSNHVIAVLQTGYDMLCECGFTAEEARSVSSALVRNNVEQVIAEGGVKALTGPIERGDLATVQSHLKVLDDEQKMLYKVCGSKLVKLAMEKNAKQDYTEISQLLSL